MPARWVGSVAVPGSFALNSTRIASTGVVPVLAGAWVNAGVNAAVSFFSSMTCVFPSGNVKVAFASPNAHEHRVRVRVHRALGANGVLDLENADGGVVDQDLVVGRVDLHGVLRRGRERQRDQGHGNNQRAAHWASFGLVLEREDHDSPNTAPVKGVAPSKPGD